MSGSGISHGNVINNAGAGAGSTGALDHAAAAGVTSMSNSGIAASDQASKDNEAMNAQALLNNARKASSELLKGAI